MVEKLTKPEIDKLRINGCKKNTEKLAPVISDAPL